MKKEEKVHEPFEWKPYDELMLLYALYGLKPCGMNYHFMMVIIWEKFKTLIGKEVPLSVVKEKLHTYYNFEALDEMSGEMEFPQKDFFLPRSEFPEIYSDAHSAKTPKA